MLSSCLCIDSTRRQSFDALFLSVHKISEQRDTFFMQLVKKRQTSCQKPLKMGHILDEKLMYDELMSFMVDRSLERIS